MIHIIERVYSIDGNVTGYETANIAFYDYEEAANNLTSLGYASHKNGTYSKKSGNELIVANVKSMNVC